MLFVQTSTLDCVLSNKCIPCLYKLYPSGNYSEDDMHSVSAEKIEVSFPPNQRPEMCPRSKSTDFCGPYNSSQSILTVGDGDFSFSLSIAEHFYKTNKRMKFFATSHESYKSVVSTYPSGEANIKRLKQLNVTVIHEVDATTLSATSQLGSHTFDVIIWNFPCIRVTDGMDGQTNDLEVNRNLLRTFFSNLHPYLTPLSGEVHVTHKTIEPFSWWGLVDLAVESDLNFEGSIVFDKYNYPGYINRKVLDKKSFPSNDAQTYIFTSKLNQTAVSNKKDGASSNSNGNDSDADIKKTKTSKKRKHSDNSTHSENKSDSSRRHKNVCLTLQETDVIVSMSDPEVKQRINTFMKDLQCTVLQKGSSNSKMKTGNVLKGEQKSDKKAKR